MAFEEEVAYLIRSDNPAEVADQVASLEKVGGYQLVEQPNQFIVDTYFDTPMRDIRAAKHSVRIRNVNDKILVTIKGPSTKTKAGNSVRTENEFEWPYKEVSPDEMFELFGLKRMQVRVCDRRVRDVVSKHGNPTPVAELAIDDLTYLFGNERSARLYEVEIERKNKSNTSLSFLGDSLKKKVPELEKWDHSKLAMGNMLAIALLINTDPETNVVNDSSFEALDYLLS